MIRIKEVICIVSLALVVILSGCNKAPDKTVLAKVNREAITAEDFKKQFEDLSPQLQQALANDTKMRKDYLDDLIAIELVIQEAKRQGLDKDTEFKKNLEAKKQKVEEYKKQLDLQLQAATRDELFNSMLKKDLGEKLKNLPPPTDKEALDFYNKNKDKIRSAAGKQISFKEVEPQIKLRLMQEKQRPLYIEYTKSLRAKASVSIDDKALDATVAGLSRTADIPEGLTVPKAPAMK